MPKKTSLLKGKKGELIVIGGAEDKIGDCTILSRVVKRSQGGKLLVVTAASELPDKLWLDYQKVFKSLGAKQVEHLAIEEHISVKNSRTDEIFRNVKTVFFTGGDQLKLTAKVGGTPVEKNIFNLFESGGTIAGTSAGASVMGKFMLVGYSETESHKVGDLLIAPGLGLVTDMIIDQHFAQRARIGRLLAAIAQNPGVLGVGIDEDTAIVLENSKFKVIGTNAVYVVDGHSITHTNVSDSSTNKTMSLHNVKLHVLSSDEEFDLDKMEPLLKKKAG